MTDATVEAQLKQLDEEMKKAKSPGEKDAIKKRQDQLKRQLKGSKTKQMPIVAVANCQYCKN